MRRRHLFAVAVLSMVLCPLTMAESKADRVQVGRNIVVDQGEKAGDVVCVACSIRIRGETSGDVVAVAGNVTLEEGASVAGDTVAVAGSVRVEAGAQIGGDTVAVAGSVQRDPTARIGGEVSVRSGGGWILLIFVMPLLMLGAFIALIIWLIQRSRRTPQVPGYPPSTAS